MWSLCSAHRPCPSRKSALDKMWMNDRLCPSVTSFMEWGGGSGLVLGLWFFLPLLETFLAFEFVWRAFANKKCTLPTHLCSVLGEGGVRCEAKLAVFPLESSVFPGGCIGLCKCTVSFKLSPDSFSIR